MNTPTVCIDLGASYTKVSYRKPLSRLPGKHFSSGETKVARIGGTIIIPSIMIQTGDRRQPWCAGEDAAKMTPSRNMKVFDNWKSDFYSCSFDAGMDDPVWNAAGNFFRWLLEQVSSLGVICDNTVLIRVTMPALLKYNEEQSEKLKRCMLLNGWPVKIEVKSEPLANLVGVLTEGRNYVSAYGKLSYGPTLDDNYIFQKIRSYALESRRNKHMQLSVVDFGSFTLDAAKIKLDLDVGDFNTFPAETVSPKSWEIGIFNDLDKPCFSKLFELHGVNGHELSFETKELMKVALYAGDAYAPQQGQLTIGESDEDKCEIASKIEDYCNKAWDELKAYCHESEVIALTGGGTCIAGVRDFFRKQCKNAGVKVIDIPAERETACVKSKSAGLFLWKDTGKEGGLGRLATAMGGASIMLGFERDDQCRKFRRGTPL